MSCFNGDWSQLIADDVASPAHRGSSECEVEFQTRKITFTTMDKKPPKEVTVLDNGYLVHIHWIFIFSFLFSFLPTLDKVCCKSD